MVLRPGVLGQALMMESPTGRCLQSPADLAFLRARDNILSHLHHDLSLPQIAGVAGITPRHLNRLFVARLGMPAGEFTLRTRIDRARHLLHERDATRRYQRSPHGHGTRAGGCQRGAQRHHLDLPMIDGEPRPWQALADGADPALAQVARGVLHTADQPPQITPIAKPAGDF